MTRPRIPPDMVADTGAEIAWWQENKDRVLRVACAMLTNLIVTTEKAGPKEIVDFAAKIVMEITKRSEPL